MSMGGARGLRALNSPWFMVEAGLLDAILIYGSFWVVYLSSSFGF